MKTKTDPAPSYTAVPVQDIVVDDADLPRNPHQKYDWIALGDKAVALAKKKPSAWQLVGEDAPTTMASNITAGKIKQLTGERFEGWVFTGRCSNVVRSETGGKRATVWIKATRADLL